MSKMTAHFSNHRHRQTGIALVASLVIMMVLTILGVTVMNMTSLEEKMAFNTQDRYLARYLAESSVFLKAIDKELPPPNEAGVSNRAFALTSADIPKLAAATVQITYTQSVPYSNLPISNTKAQYDSSGSGEDNPPIYQIFARASTQAATTAQMRTVYYWRRPPSTK